MNRKIYGSILVAICMMGCGSSGTKYTQPPPVELITATSGTPQTATVNTAFAAPLVAKVTTGGSPTSGVTVTFTAPATGASGTFAGGVSTATTDANGLATSAVFSANGTTGAYTVAATVSGVSTPANFNLTNTAAVVTKNYSFYLSGLEFINNIHGSNFYAIAGAVAIDANGNVVAGEQDYNDGYGFTSPQPSGDTITGGTLTVNASTGQGTLTLITNNTSLGASGTETLGVQFVNAKHALVIQFDGSATSSGSLDLQTLPSTLSGGFSFTFSGVDSDYYSVVGGGVFSISETSLENGVLDVDDGEAGTVTLGTAFTGTISAPDSFGRGTITGPDIATAINYYIVGPEAIRIIDVDAEDSFVGSAYGQGAGSFSNASLGSSVFGVESNSLGNLYAAAGMFTTIPDPGTVQGVADDDEEGNVVSGSSISGTYTVASNGYGSLTITPGDLGDVSALGIYMTDPNLNLNDPNNTTSGLGGALVADLDVNVNGTGILIPQTDTSTDSFAGPYAFGAQVYTDLGTTGWEFDFIGQGSVTSGVLAGTGLLNDPGNVFGEGSGGGGGGGGCPSDVGRSTSNNSPTPAACDATHGTLTGNAVDSGVTFSGTATPDMVNPGRYTFPSGIMVGSVGGPLDLTTVIYQASGGQLLWLDEDGNTLFLGSLQQQGSLTSQATAKRAAVKTNLQHKH
jgi:hypothetical protein